MAINHKIKIRPRSGSGRYGVNFSLEAHMTVVGFCVFLFMWAIHVWGVMEPFELSVYDMLMRNRPSIEPDPTILIVGITEEDIQARKQWPFSDEIMARTLKILNEMRPSVLGLDVHRDFRRPPGEDAFIAELAKPNVVAIHKIGDPYVKAIQGPENMPDNRLGFNDLVMDGDNVIRRSLLFADNQQGKTVPSFAWQLAFHHFKQKNIVPYPDKEQRGVIHWGNATFSQLKRNDGGYQLPEDNGFQILLNYRPIEKNDRDSSAAKIINFNKIRQLYDENPEKLRQMVTGKIVLIGTTAVSLKDVFYTPYTSNHKKTAEGKESRHMSGVVVHANILSHLLSAISHGNSPSTPQATVFDFWPEGYEWTLLFVWVLLGAVLVWSMQSLIKFLLFGFLLMSLDVFASIHLFNQGLWIPIVTPLVGFFFSIGWVFAAKVSYNANYDGLTGLPNRRLLVKRVRQLQRRSWFSLPDFNTELDKPKEADIDKLNGAILLLDLESFKVINAVLGREVGDQLLMRFTKRLISILDDIPHEYSLARLGGTEFGILLRNPPHKQALVDLANEILHQMHGPFTLNGEDVFAVANIGISLIYPNENRDLLQDAHAAMNQAKALGKHSPEVFEHAMTASAVANFQLERDLRQVIAKGLMGKDSVPYLPDFPVYYQPLIDLKTGKIGGFEALLRWIHPKRGLVSPYEFIPVAEETGLIVPIGEWVLQQACKQMLLWQEKNPHDHDLIISVNLSGKQFLQENLLNKIAEIIEDTGFNPHNLKLEITETVVMDDFETTLRILKALRKMDVHLSIDDFGTGYSSLSYLTRLPANTLKVDQSFVRRLFEHQKETAIVEVVVDLAHKLSMDVLAEGIETQEQLAKLRELGCEYGQGYLFAKPLPIPEAEALLMSNPTW